MDQTVSLLVVLKSGLLLHSKVFVVMVTVCFVHSLRIRRVAHACAQSYNSTYGAIGELLWENQIAPLLRHLRNIREVRSEGYVSADVEWTHRIQGHCQDFFKGGAQPSLAHQSISPTHRMYCAHITGNLKCF